MNHGLEQKRKLLELSRVNQSKLELEFKIEELQEQILRVKEHIRTQEETEARIKKELATMQGE